MLLVKKCQFFLYLDLVKIRPEKVRNNILEKKETFFYYNNKNFWQSHKSHCLFSTEIRLEIRFNNVLDRKETFFDYKKNFSKSQKSHFSKGVNLCFWLKNANFFIFLLSLKTRLETRFNNVPDRKETFFLSIKTKHYKVPKNCIFPKGKPCFWSKNAKFFFI